MAAADAAVVVVVEEERRGCWRRNVEQASAFDGIDSASLTRTAEQGL